jgi:homoserine/homoserine lactone efflux protein
VGVAALVWLGIRNLRGGRDLPQPGAAATHGFGRGALIALSNPKALIFYSGVLPQFVDPARSALPQFAILAATFASLELCVTAGVCWAAEVVAPLLRRPATVRWLHRAGGVLLIGAAALVALSRVSP